MPINAGYEYFEAEKKYLQAQTLEEKIKCLEEMIKAAPKHKSSENFVAELKTRLKKLREKSEKSHSVGKGKKGIKKVGFQVALLGKTSSGKSLLLNKLTNASSPVSSHPFTTTSPIIGTMNYQGVKAQIVDLPSIGSKGFDAGTANNADCVLLIINTLQDIAEVEPYASKNQGSKIRVINKIDLLSTEELRKLQETCKSKKLNALLVSAQTSEGIEALKKKIFESMNVIRIYMKEPSKEPSKIPAVLPKGSTVKNVAENIYKGFSLQVKEARLTGPSGKFANQKVGLSHVLKDLDVVEFKT